MAVGLVVTVSVQVVIVAQLVDTSDRNTRGFEKICFVEHVFLAIHKERLSKDKSVQRSERGEVEPPVVPAGLSARGNGNSETVADVVAVEGFGGEKIVFVENGRPLQLDKDGTSIRGSVAQVERVGSCVTAVQESVVGHKMAFVFFDGKGKNSGLAFDLVEMASFPVDIVAIQPLQTHK